MFIISGTLTLLSAITHLFNSVYIVVDLFVTAMPVRLFHFVYPMIYAIVYIIFSVIYWAADGVNQNGFDYIYEPLDWDSPGTAALYSLLASFVGVPLVQVRFVNVLLFYYQNDHENYPSKISKEYFTMWLCYNDKKFLS